MSEKSEMLRDPEEIAIEVVNKIRGKLIPDLKEEDIRGVQVIAQAIREDRHLLQSKIRNFIVELAR